MALSADQKATLQLLLEREQSYAGLAELLGIEEAEVRDRARSALQQLASGDPDRNVAISDYLLGQADPIGRADVVRHLREDPADHRLAGELIEELRTVVPGATLPKLPGEPRAGRFLTRVPGARAEAPPREGRPPITSRLSPERSRLLVALGAGAVVLIAVVLAVSGAFGGDDDGDDSATTAGTTDGQSATTPAEENVVPFDLEPVGGSDASGRITFGLASADQPFIDLELSDLQPPNADQAYVIWFLIDDGTGFPIPSAIPVNAQGAYDDRVSVPAETLGIALRADAVVIALNDRRRLNRQIAQALEGDRTELQFPGGSVLEARLRGQDAGGADQG